jgi:hypothetical protein
MVSLRIAASLFGSATANWPKVRSATEQFLTLDPVGLVLGFVPGDRA